MKTLVTSLKLIAFTVIAITTISCEDADDNGNIIDNNNSAFDLTTSTADFSKLNEALILTGLDGTLDQSGGTFTVFAPTDLAFDNFLADNGWMELTDVPVDVLRNTLRYHLLATALRSTELASGYTKTLGQNSAGDLLDLYISTASGVILNELTTVTQADINVDNGVVHVVDKVIALPTIATLIVVNPDFSSLETALQQQALVATLEDPAVTFTVFAPLNASFDSLITEDPLGAGWTGIADILALANLTDVLTYHVVSDVTALRAGDIINNMVVNPITIGSSFTIDNTSGVVITDMQARQTTITLTDITAINGVVHGLDSVLLP